MPLILKGFGSEVVAGVGGKSFQGCSRELASGPKPTIVGLGPLVSAPDQPQNAVNVQCGKKTKPIHHMD